MEFKEVKYEFDKKVEKLDYARILKKVPEFLESHYNNK